MITVRKVFWILNKFFMVPAFRLGLGPLLGTPFGGYMMVLKNTGHKTGKLRWTPVNYAIQDGCVYCLAGFGKIAHWYKNIQAKPSVELLLPSGAVAAEARELLASPERLTIVRQILKNSGFAAFLFGINPFTASDSVLEEKTQDYIVLGLEPKGIGSGTADPGGWLWLFPTIGSIWLIWWLIVSMM